MAEMRRNLANKQPMHINLKPTGITKMAIVQTGSRFQAMTPDAPFRQEPRSMIPPLITCLIDSNKGQRNKLFRACTATAADYDQELQEIWRRSPKHTKNNVHRRCWNRSSSQ